MSEMALQISTFEAKEKDRQGEIRQLSLHAEINDYDQIFIVGGSDESDSDFLVAFIFGWNEPGSLSRLIASLLENPKNITNRNKVWGRKALQSALRQWLKTLSHESYSRPTRNSTDYQSTLGLPEMPMISR